MAEENTPIAAKPSQKMLPIDSFSATQKKMGNVSSIEKTSGGGASRDTFVRASETADVLVVCGDMTDYGLPEEAAILAQDIRAYVRIPCAAVVGNHDFESGRSRRCRTF